MANGWLDNGTLVLWAPGGSSTQKLYRVKYPIVSSMPMYCLKPVTQVSFGEISWGSEVNAPRDEVIEIAVPKSTFI